MTTLILIYAFGFCLNAAMRWESRKRLLDRGLKTIEEREQALQKDMEDFKWQTGIELTPLTTWYISLFKKYAAWPKVGRYAFDAATIILWPINLSFMFFLLIVELVNIFGQVWSRNR